MWRTTKWCQSGQHEEDGRDDGRDMGGIQNFPPVLNPLCIKAFPEIWGEMGDFFEIIKKIKIWKSADAQYSPKE